MLTSKETLLETILCCCYAGRSREKKITASVKREDVNAAGTIIIIVGAEYLIQVEG